jgi:hypothetical protein
VSDAGNHDGIDVEPEPEREHRLTVAPAARRVWSLQLRTVLTTASRTGPSGRP